MCAKCEVLLKNCTYLIAIYQLSKQLNELNGLTPKIGLTLTMAYEIVTR